MILHYLPGSMVYTVTVSRREVDAFAETWPGFGPSRALMFQFTLDGDLADMDGNMEQMDPAGLNALGAKAEEWGRARIASGGWMGGKKSG